jgi:hypothetical protein
MDALPCETSNLEWIVWEDAVGDSSRTDRDAIAGITLARNSNVGWVIHEDEKRVVLAHGVSTTGEIDHFTIPVSCILERHKVLSQAAKRKRTKR